MSQYQFLGNLTRMEREENGVLLHCGDHLLRLSFLCADIVRLTLARNGNWHEGPDYAIAKNDWPGADFSIEETADQASLKTSVLEVRVKRSPCRVAFYDVQGNLLNQDDEAFGIAWEGSEVAVFKSLLRDERFFGLGEKVGELDRRGHEFVMWNTDSPGYSDKTDRLYQSHPFFIGVRENRAYGIFFNNTFRSTFSMGAGNHRLYSFRAEGGPVDYFFFAGPTVKQVLSRYSELVGRMPLPPKWALGYQQSRWSYYPDNEVRTVARTFRDKKIPADVIHLDIHHMDGYRCFTFDPERFPDPKKLLAELREMGFKVVVIVDPGIKVDPGYSVYENGVAGGHFIKFPDGELYVGDVWAGPSHFANFTRPETRTWWGDLHEDFLDKGVAGFWNDMNEPAVWGVEAPELVEFDENGKKVSFKKIHNVFGHLMTQATYEGLRRLRPEERPFLLTRAGFSGTQRYAAIWTADNISTFEHLEIAIRICQSIGLSGIPFVGTDIGGFQGSPTAELYVRWMQFGAFTPFFRSHTSFDTPDQEPWSFGERAESINRETIELRYRLVPYTYTAFQQASATGLPIMRPLFLEFPREAETYESQNHTTFLWGEDILVAPVTRAGQRMRKVYLPEGTWHDFWKNETHEGGQYVCVEAPLERLPLFVRAGAVIPMQEVQQFVDEKPAEEMELHVYPGAERTSELYEDDGHSFAYEKGQWSKTRFRMIQTGTTVSLEISERTGKFVPVARDYKIVLHGLQREPKSVLVDGKKHRIQAAAIDMEAGTIAVVIKDDGKEHEVVFDLRE